VDGRSTERLTEERELGLAAEIAEEYYLQEKSMVAIAEAKNLTRFQVARLIQLARQTGIVQIQIHPPQAVDQPLSEELQDLLGIREVIVTASRGAGGVRDVVGRAAADLLPTRVHAGEVVGLTWSKTIVSMVSHLKHLEPCTLVQLAGHNSQDVSSPGSVEVVRRAAEISGGTAYPIYAPMIASDNYVAHALREDPGVQRAMDLYDRVSVAVVSIGSWGSGGSSVYDALGERERLMGDAAGVVGEISGRLFDADGAAVTQVIDDRVIGVTLAQLAAMPCVIGTAYGASRAPAVRAARRSVPFDVLVTDRELALHLLGRDVQE